MLVSELAPLYMLLRIAVLLVLVSLGGLDNRVGQAGLVLFILSELGLIPLMIRTIRGARATGKSPSFWSFFWPVEGLPDGVVKEVEITYWDSFSLDLYRPEVSTVPGPALVYVHPGSWMRGRPGKQARAMFHRLAVRGWTIFDIRYPLSPAATFPEHLVGVKRAVAWVRENAGELGVDPHRLAVSGGSSGAHLAALAALTAGNADLQPGFETADTSVSACVTFYGIYDLLVRNPTRYDWPFIAQHVMKATPLNSPDLYELGSPIDQVHDGAPPFFVLHGEFDSIVLPSESEHFVAALDDGNVPARYFEVPGAQHGFDAVASLRTRAVADMVVEWLEQRVASHQAQ